MSSDYYTAIFDDEKAASQVVSEIIQESLNAFEQRIDEMFLSTLDVPYATEMALMKVQKLIELAMLGHDGSAVREDEQLEVLVPDGEPSPSTIDSWARGTVAVKKIAADDHHNIPHAFSNDAPSVSSAMTGKSSANGRASSRASSRGTARTNATSSGHANNTLDTTGKIIELDEGDEFAALGTTGYLFDMLQKSKRKKEQGFIEKDTEKGEFTLLQEQMEQAKKELRGKKFILDRYGKPVVVGSVNAEKLAPYATPLHLNIRSTGGDVDLDNMSTGSGGSAGRKDSNAEGKDGHGKPKKKQFIRVAGSRGVEESSFKPTISLAVTLSGVEHIPKLNPGVSVRSSTSVRSGDRLPDDPKHLSKKQYLSQSLSRRSMLGENSTLDTMSRTLDANSSLLSPAERTRGGEKSVFSNTSAGRSYGAGSRAGGSVTAMRSLDGLPDMDQMEGGRPVVRAAAGYHDMSDEELGLGPVNTKGMPKNGTLPKKPSEKQKANINLLGGSPENGRPKDRDLPRNVHYVADRTHLPAPPLGQITGHGGFADKRSPTSKQPSMDGSNWFLSVHQTSASRLRNNNIEKQALNMNQQLAAQLESAPYDVSTAAALEGFVTSQLSSKTYDFNANKALLKNYQVNPSIAKADFVSKVLILSLMRLPSSDFLALTYMIPPQVQSNANIVTIQKCVDALERGRFREFWEQFVPAQALFTEAVGFVDSVRLFIVSNLRDTFKDMPKALFQQQLGLDAVSVVSFCDSNKFIEKIAGEVVVFASNEENQRKSTREDSVKMDESLKLVELLRKSGGEAL